ncbi:MAG: amylo-alpha-1,6-glucosidase [Candidatus Woesearchaeota archaeon]
MRISHDLPGCAVSRDTCDSTSFMLSNGIGGFLYLSSGSDSKFKGLFLVEDDVLYKTIENIRLASGGPIEIERHETYVHRAYEDNTDEIRLPQGINGLKYTLTKKSDILLDLDCRQVNDLRSFGRLYTARIDEKKIIIKFTKQTDHREDMTDGIDEFSRFIVIEPKDFDPHADYEQMDLWFANQYGCDTERNDSPDHRYVYQPFRIRTKSLLIAYGKTREDALSELERLRTYKFKRRNRRHHDTSDNHQEDNALACAKASLERSKVMHEGITRLYAGYPWFFQFWSRDENISLGALIRMHEFGTVKDILMHYLHNISADGRLPNRVPSSDLSSADGIGWFWKRMADFISELDRSGLIDTYMSKKEIEEVKDRLTESITRIRKNHLEDGFVINNTNETWMDTQWKGQDGRPGARIEIQAMQLRILKLMYDLSDDEKYKKMEEELCEKVRKTFWNRDILADGIDDWTVRPNIFIAYYIYPELLAKEEWTKCFTTALDKLWLGWGGLASIATDHPLFTDRYTGVTNQSYHRGDSWYWINDLAALCLHRNDPKTFKGTIDQIVAASSEEILWHGSVGDHAEVSSAAQLESRGALAQTWSAAMFIEMMMELKK